MIKDYDYSRIDNYEKLRKLQLTQIEIFKYVADFCDKNNLRYSVAYGTLLGAVRHSGFIPWDDDLDICMPREDYNKFIELWQNTPDYLLQNHDTNRDFTPGFTKIRKNNTAFVQQTDVGRSYHKGIFIDIFPYDRVPNNKIQKKFQLLHAMFCQLFTRQHSPSDNGALLKICSDIILFFVPKSKYYKMSQYHLKKICKYNSQKDLKYFSISSFVSMHKYYPSDIFDNLVKINFEGLEVNVFRDYHKMLTEFYGDYMKLPPESEQNWYHHPILIDFDNNCG